MKQVNLIITISIILSSLTCNAQNFVERLNFDSTFTSSVNNYNSSFIGSATSTYIENRYHQKAKSWISQPASVNNGGGTRLVKQIDDLTNLQDSNGVLSINFWWGINHPEAKKVYTYSN